MPWNDHDDDWYNHGNDFYNKTNITAEDEKSMIGQVSFFLDKCPKGWKKQHMTTVQFDDFEYQDDTSSCNNDHFDTWF